MKKHIREFILALLTLFLSLQTSVASGDLYFSDFLFGRKEGSPSPYTYQNFKLPLDIEKIIIDRTGTSGIFLITEIHYRTLEKYQMLGFNVEFSRRPDAKGELILHSKIVVLSSYGYVEKKTQTIYNCDMKLVKLFDMDEAEIMKYLTPL